MSWSSWKVLAGFGEACGAAGDLVGYYCFCLSGVGGLVLRFLGCTIFVGAGVSVWDLVFLCCFFWTVFGFVFVGLVDWLRGG